jgi:hypothetical protein
VERTGKRRSKPFSRTLEASAAWTDRGQVHLPSRIVLTFQRFAWPSGGVIERAPSSLGALPVGIGVARDLVLPLADDECFWIGVSLAPEVAGRAMAIDVELADGEHIDATTGATFDDERPGLVMLPDTPRIDGIHRQDGRFDVFVRATHHREGRPCRRVRLDIEPDATIGAAARNRRGREPFAVAIRLLDYATFTAETGLPPPAPLDVDAGYKGWRLP